MKGLPWSKVMCSGSPKRLIHPDRRADAHDEEDVSNIRTASNQFVDLPMVVKRYQESSEGGWRLMMSTWMCPNRQVG